MMNKQKTPMNVLAAMIGAAVLSTSTAMAHETRAFDAKAVTELKVTPQAAAKVTAPALTHSAPAKGPKAPTL